MNPIKTIALLGLVVGLSACGGGGRLDTPTAARSFATGPIFDACLRAGRTAASRSLCGCVQASADQSLTRGEQSRATRFFRDPHLAQETRQSDRPGDERYWKRYRAFVETAERSCA
ncbi:hypothetical protein [Jannaschia pohangensis]|uniref:Arginine transporter n=1 Tax=Jannaschia pohangensis TaxID=390807 RepID=A0A1I3QA37_9RHOB|nr:hypothetical protein [Jannaschia pohangensis]SFJ31124.1 hypothetical protein SAMN04488095_2477 [Jannaschia pohangensis]